MTSSPLIADTQGEAAHLAVRLVAITELLGLTPAGEEPGVDRAQILASLNELARLGVSRKAPSLEAHFTPKALARLLSDVLTAVEESPMPEHEWTSMSDLLGDEMLAPLVGVSTSSLHRYRAGERATPDPVAGRLHAILLIVADLAGTYNDFGIRRWFDRPRSALGGQGPAEILSGDWSPDASSVQSVRDLARALLGASAA